MLTPESCRVRQERFIKRLDEEGIPAAVISSPRDIYYLTGILPEMWWFPYPNVLFLGPGLRSWLATGLAGAQGAVDEVIHYPINTLFTFNPDNHRRICELLPEPAARTQNLARLGYQREALPVSIAHTIRQAASPRDVVPVDEILIDLQLRKDPDEIELIRGAVRATLAGYTRAQQLIEPGISELYLMTECQAAAQRYTGRVHFFGGDFQSGQFGGFARDRRIEKGELYIIDAWSDVGGYWCDMARTWSVGGEPTDLQASVYRHIAGILESVPQRVKPGGDTSEFWWELDALVREHPYLADIGMKDHGGHGIGLHVHEMPDLNRDRGGTFEVGSVFTCEPAAYSRELNAGVRLESVFAITPSGVEVLEPYPLSIIQDPCCPIRAG
jgi:Xaa-Pro dipeptidase